LDREAVEEAEADEEESDEDADAKNEEEKEFEPMFGELKKEIDRQNELKE